MTSGGFEQRPERRLEQTFGQTNYNLFIRWQALRRDPEYRAFCDQYGQYFDDNGMMRWELLPTEDAEKEADHIKEIYGLDYIYHFNTDLELDGFIDSCVFIEPFAVNYLFKEKNLDYKAIPEIIVEIFDPFWEPNFIHLRVNVGEGITEAQLKEEFLEKIKESRELAGIRRKQSIPSETDFRVYDLLTYEEKTRKEIMKEIWPEDFEKAFSGPSEVDRDKLYKELTEKYRDQGIEDWDEKAWEEAYEGESPIDQGIEDSDPATDKTAASPKKLYDRLADGIKRVKQYMKRIKL
jgi:hypothetical protein